MATSTSSTGKSTPADARALIAAKIQEGVHKVRGLGRLADEVDRDCEALREKVDGMAAVMESELRLDEYCSDLGDMNKARLDYHGASLSEAERQSLRQIHDLAASAIADYEALLGPAPASTTPSPCSATPSPWSARRPWLLTSGLLRSMEGTIHGSKRLSAGSWSTPYMIRDYPSWLSWF